MKCLHFDEKNLRKRHFIACHVTKIIQDSWSICQPRSGVSGESGEGTGDEGDKTKLLANQNPRSFQTVFSAYLSLNSINKNTYLLQDFSQVLHHLSWSEVLPLNNM